MEIQGWIFEHFPRIGCRRPCATYTEDSPRAMRTVPLQGRGDVLPYRAALDKLTTDDVSWTSYVDHRAHLPFEDVSFYSGYIRCGPIMHAYLPERVLRQLGHVQGIPRSPRDVTDTPISPEEIDQSWMQHELHVVDHSVRGPRLTTYLGQCVDGYMQWFHRISHPYIIPPSEGDADRVPVREASSSQAHPGSHSEVSLNSFYLFNVNNS